MLVVIRRCQKVKKKKRKTCVFVPENVSNQLLKKNVRRKNVTHPQIPFSFETHQSIESGFSPHFPFSPNPFSPFPSLICLLLWQSRGLKHKPSTNTHLKALEHEVEQVISGCTALKSQFQIQHFFFFTQMNTSF